MSLDPDILQEQKDEIEVLQSILEEGDFFGISIEEAPFSFALNVTPQCEHESLMLKGTPSDDKESKQEELELMRTLSGRKTDSLTVKYISPIRLMCTLPPEYPRSAMPDYHISCNWLSHKQLSSICQQLDQMWESNEGSPILFLWSEWIRHDLWEALNLTDTIELDFSESAAETEQGDPRAIVGCNNLDEAVLQVLRYNAERDYKQFQLEEHDCMICFTTFQGSDCRRIRRCGHFYCTSCFQQYVDTNVTEGKVLNIKCPEPSCKETLPEGLIKDLLSEEQFEKYERLLLNKTLDSMPDLVYCPRCETPSLEDDQNLGECPKCMYTFCTLCYDSWHQGSGCVDAETKAQMAKRKATGAHLQHREQSRKLQQAAEELQGAALALKISKRCPSCKTLIQKTEGCNKMTCCYCHVYFCWLCLSVIDGYEHFQNKCVLFDEQEIHNWEQQMRQQVPEGYYLAQAARAEGVNLELATCPTCRQRNAKIGNNNRIRCWACHNSFCFLCKTVVRRGVLHFTPAGCPQHS